MDSASLIPQSPAGVTLYDPLRRYGAGKGTRVAVVGLGGLGTIGLKIAAALGCTVTAVSRSRAKAAQAAAAGATAFIDSSSVADMAAAAGSFDLVLNTIPTEHDFAPYTALVARSGGKHVILGVNSALAACLFTASFLPSARVVSSSIGSIAATQEVMDLCAEHGIRPDLRIIPVEGINAAYEALDSSNDAGVRYVIDIAGSLNEGAVERCKASPPPKLGPGTPLTISSVLWTLGGMVFLGRAW
jgi:uncharacterized zinc-type alcohol dehydrogenase-like protein